VSHEAGVSAGPWSRRHPCCRHCGRTDRPPYGWGFCWACYQTNRQWRLRLGSGRASHDLHHTHCGCLACADQRQAAAARSLARDWRGIPFDPIVIQDQERDDGPDDGRQRTA
jgi:hypothetical protein